MFGASWHSCSPARSYLLGWTLAPSRVRNSAAVKLNTWFAEFNKLRTFFSDQAYVRDSIVLRGGVIRTSLVIVFTLKRCALNSKPSTG